VPRRFVGRAAELRQIRAELAPVIAYGEMLGGPLLLTGPRGVGKTSLLLEVRRWAESEGFVVAHTSGVKYQPFLGDVLDRVTAALQATTAAAPRRRRIEQLSATVGVPMASASVSLRWPEAEQLSAVSPALVSPVEDLLHECAVAVRESGGAGLLLLIDELHEPLRSIEADRYVPNADAVRDAAVILNVLQHLDNDRDLNPLGMIAAGLPEAGTLLMRAATFAERVNEIRLGELGPSEARDVLSVPAAELGVRWHGDALAAAIELADGYPQALQVIGKWTWDGAELTEGAVITEADFQAAVPAITAHLDTMYERRWESATATERAFLTAMAELEIQSEGGRVRRGMIADRMGRSTDSIGPIRDSLLSKGIVEDAGHGLVRFTIPGFAAYVRESA